MPKTIKSQKKKTAIIEAASKVFARKGYAATLMAEVAVEAGVGKGTIYEYFKSKDDLFFDVFQWFFAQSNEAIKVDIATLKGTASERLTAMNDSIMKVWAAEMDSFALVMEFWSASAATTFRQRFKKAFKTAYVQFIAIVSALIQDGMSSGEFRPDIAPKVVAASLVGTWDALLLQKWFDAIEDPLTYSREFLKVVLAGLSEPTNNAI